MNRNFRNEGIDATHNPEFTMLEFYCAYMDVNGMMDFAEAMIKESVQKATGGSLQVKYGENEIDFSRFERLTMKQAIAKYFPSEWKDLGDEKFSEDWLDEPTRVQRLILFQFEPFDKASERWKKVQSYQFENIEKKADKNILTLFETVVEEYILHPTFIIDYPKSISPLSKASPLNPNVSERFELFINGMECANGFSELNDPQEQYERFVDQMKERETGDEEAMVLDEDYIRALAFGMPPAAGIGIGIDRLVMLLTNKHSIRDVILFPHMRPEKRDAETERHGDAETK